MKLWDETFPLYFVRIYAEGDHRRSCLSVCVSVATEFPKAQKIFACLVSGTFKSHQQQEASTIQP